MVETLKSTCLSEMTSITYFVSLGVMKHQITKCMVTKFSKSVVRSLRKSQVIFKIGLPMSTFQVDQMKMCNSDLDSLPKAMPKYKIFGQQELQNRLYGHLKITVVG